MQTIYILNLFDVKQVIIASLALSTSAFMCFKFHPAMEDCWTLFLAFSNLFGTIILIKRTEVWSWILFHYAAKIKEEPKNTLIAWIMVNHASLFTKFWSCWEIHFAFQMDSDGKMMQSKETWNKLSVNFFGWRSFAKLLPEPCNKSSPLN